MTLRKRVEIECNQIPHELSNSIIESMPRRLSAVVKPKGKYTKYKWEEVRSHTSIFSNPILLLFLVNNCQKIGASDSPESKHSYSFWQFEQNTVTFEGLNNTCLKKM